MGAFISGSNREFGIFPKKLKIFLNTAETRFFCFNENFSIRNIYISGNIFPLLILVRHDLLSVAHLLSY